MMTTIIRPSQFHPNNGRIRRGIDSGSLAPMPDMPVYQPVATQPDLTTRPIPAPPPPPVRTYPLFEALRIGCEKLQTFTIRTIEHDAWLTYDPIAHWVTGSCVGSVAFWRGKARALDACSEGSQRMVIGAMLTYDPALEQAQWAVALA